MSCQASRRTPICPLQLDKSHDVTEQTRVLKGHPRGNLRIKPMFLPQLKKNHETYPSPRDEARLTFIVCREIPCSTSNMKGALTSLMEIQSSQEHRHKSRGILRSLKQQERAPYTSNQLEMRTNLPALAPEPSHVPKQT